MVLSSMLIRDDPITCMPIAAKLEKKLFRMILLREVKISQAYRQRESVADLFGHSSTMMPLDKVVLLPCSQLARVVPGRKSSGAEDSIQPTRSLSATSAVEQSLPLDTRMSRVLLRFTSKTYQQSG